jgi:hypothetical protein
MYSCKHILPSITLCLAFILTSSCSAPPKVIDQAPGTFLEDSGFIWFLDPTKGPLQCVGSFHREDGSLIGGGTLIDGDTIITAAHVVDESVGVSLFRVGKRFYDIKSICLHEDYESETTIKNDIAVVELTEAVIGVEFPEVSIDPSSLVPFRRLITVGYSLGIKKISKPGVMLYYGMLEREPNFFKILPVDETLGFGDSGGGVFVIDDGKFVLVGVVSYLTIIREHIIDNSILRIDRYTNWLQNAGVLPSTWSPLDEIDSEMPDDAALY